MQAVAQYLSGQEIAKGRPVGTAPKAAQTCIACHGTDGIGIMPEYPNLTGQHPDYIEQALKAYRSGQRKNAVMAGMAGALKDEDIDALAELLRPPAAEPVFDRRSARTTVIVRRRERLTRRPSWIATPTSSTPVKASM